MIIEQVQVKDAEKLLDIYAPYVEKTAISFEYDVPSVEEFQNRIQTITVKFPYIKAIIDGEIVGYAYAGVFKGRRAYDWSVETTIYVKENRRKIGIGKALYLELENRLKAMGILNMNACITLPRNESKYLSNDSYLFHKEMGFTEVGVFHNSGYKFDEWFDMIWMEKMIGPHKNPPDAIRFCES